MRKILIVGASSGIGSALAERLIKENDLEVISLSRTKPDLPLYDHINYDIRSQEPLPAFEGGLDGLVYCPGSILLKPFKNLRLQDFKDDLDINLLGAIKCISHYLPALNSSGAASIVLFSTVAARIGMPFHSSIAAAKGAVEGLVRSLAAELSPRIRVNAIAPSLVKTPLAVRLTDSPAKVLNASERHPLKRIGEAKDIAAMAAFLLSADASWITGQIMQVDGGMSTIKI